MSDSWSPEYAPWAARANPHYFDDLIPDAPVFWALLEINCTVDCCGLDAFDFSGSHLRTAARFQGGDPIELADAIAGAAAQIRELDSPAISANRFDNTISTPHSYARLFELFSDELRRTDDTQSAATSPDPGESPDSGETSIRPGDAWNSRTVSLWADVRITVVQPGTRSGWWIVLVEHPEGVVTSAEVTSADILRNFELASGQ